MYLLIHALVSSPKVILIHVFDLELFGINDKKWLGNWEISKMCPKPMMTISNGNIFRVAVPSQRPATQSFDVFHVICAWINGWANNRKAGDLRRHRAHYDVTVMLHTLYRSLISRGHCITIGMYYQTVRNLLLKCILYIVDRKLQILTVSTSLIYYCSQFNVWRSIFIKLQWNLYITTT